MNRLRAQITRIQTHEGISRILLNYHGQTLTAITLELPSFAKEGSDVYICYKETEVGVAKGNCDNISFSNIFECHIETLNKGVILSTLSATHHSHKIGSIITTTAIERLDLKENDPINFFVKATEVSLEEIV